MKKLFVPILIIVTFLGCKKTESIVQNPTMPKDTVAKVNNDTIPDLATLGLRLKSATDSTGLKGGAQFMFSKNFHLTATDSYDTGTQTPGGFASEPIFLYFISSDGVDLQNDAVPYTPGMVTNLDVKVPNSGNYIIESVNFFHIPSYIQVTLRDTYLKDSTNMNKSNYQFSIDNTNPATYGKTRFQVVVR